MENTANWCYAKFEFKNCEAKEAMDEKCKNPANRKGECDFHKVEGDLRKIQMYTGYKN